MFETNGIDEIINKAWEKLRSGADRVIIAIDGRSASGKSTLAGEISERTGCAVFHTDDFFPRPEQRTEVRQSEAGGNFDRERFESEVLLPLLSGGERISYRPFDCSSMTLAPEISIGAGELVIIEGSYSCHPALRDKYDLRVFLTVLPEEQKRRIISRSGEKAESFFSRWIPLEEKYFKECGLPGCCDIVITT